MSELSQPARRIEWLVWTGVALVTLTLLLVFALALLNARNRLARPLPVYGQIADFTLTNQDGRATSLSDLRGHVWVADIIFTRCAGPCPVMTRQMKALQETVPASSGTKLVTLTTDPDFDTSPVLKAYAERFGADLHRWMFLTGTKDQIASLAIDSLKLSAVEKKPEDRQSPQDLFIHSTIFVVVDQRARLRGIFETTGEGVDPKQVKSEILGTVTRLERER